MFLSGDVSISMNKCSDFFGRGPDWQEDQSQCKGHCESWGERQLCLYPAALSALGHPQSRSLKSCEASV